MASTANAHLPQYISQGCGGSGPGHSGPGHSGHALGFPDGLCFSFSASKAAGVVEDPSGTFDGNRDHSVVAQVSGVPVPVGHERGRSNSVAGSAGSSGAGEALASQN